MAYDPHYHGIDADGLQRFTFRRVFGGPMGIVQRHAAGYSLVGRGSPAKLVYRVLSLNRVNLQRWRDAGVIDAESYLKRANCRPAFARVHPNANFCYQSLCPFCWARQAADVWKLADRVLFPASPAGRRKQADCDLLLVHRVYHGERLAPYAVDRRADLAAAFADRCSDRKGQRTIPGRGYELRHLPVLGALELTLVDVGWTQNENGWLGTWQVEVRQLLAVEPGAMVKLEGATSRRFAQPGRGDVARVVGKLWRYPAGLLRRGMTDEPPAAQWAARYLTAREGRRLAAGFGVFRASQKGVNRR